MNNEIICPGCASPVEIPDGYPRDFQICPNCGLTIDINDDGTTKETYLSE